MIMYASNAFLATRIWATRIWFMNEIASICDRVGACIDDVSRGLALDSRSGAGLYAGVGYGGPCLPKDIGALEHLVRQSGAGSDLLRAAISVNDVKRLLRCAPSETGLASGAPRCLKNQWTAEVPDDR